MIRLQSKAIQNSENTHQQLKTAHKLPLKLWKCVSEKLSVHQQQLKIHFKGAAASQVCLTMDNKVTAFLRFPVK